MDEKAEIIEAIRQAAELHGSPPGRQVFERLTGIKTSGLIGRYWTSWGEALKEAGFSPNEFQIPLDRDKVAAEYLALVEELGRTPTNADLKMKARRTPGFPAHSTILRVLGRKRDALIAVLSYAEQSGASEDIITLVRESIPAEKADRDHTQSIHKATDQGYVYLMKSGKSFRIGRTNNLDRRQYEVGVQLPEKYERVHAIRTDDPSGIEAYWHNRFGDKRLNGDWFRLTAADVRAFKKRKFM